MPRLRDYPSGWRNLLIYRIALKNLISKVALEKEIVDLQSDAEEEYMNLRS